MATLGLAEKIERIHAAFTKARIPHAFGGALALAYYAVPRTTIDIDVNVFVETDRFDSVATVLRKLGVEKIPASGSVEKAGQARAWWGSNHIDLFFSYDPVHEAMRKAVRTVSFGETTIPILAPEHLLVAKAVFNRPKDWLDIEQMLVAVDELDREEIERWLTHLMGPNDPRHRRFQKLAKDLRGG
jgi:hypothetical protein